MLKRTTSSKVVNGMLRDAFQDAGFDVSAAIKDRKNYVLISDQAAVVFTRSRERGTYSFVMGVLQEHQGKGVGAATIREAIAWMFANNSRAMVIRTIADPGIAVSSTAKGMKVEGSATFGGRVCLSVTRESFASLTGDGG